MLCYVFVCIVGFGMLTFYSKVRVCEEFFVSVWVLDVCYSPLGRWARWASLLLGGGSWSSLNFSFLRLLSL